MNSLEGSNCFIFATVQLTLLLKLATNAYLEIKSKSFGWNWFSSYQLIVYIEKEMTTLLCHECGKSFTDEPLLNIHQTRQPDKTSHSCGECSTEVIGKMALKNHKRKHKMPAVKNLEKKHKAKKEFACEECHYTTMTKAYLKDHIRRMHVARGVGWMCVEGACEKKPKTFVNNMLLLQHKKDHQNLPCQICSICLQ